jgi:hypothetical protein
VIKVRLGILRKGGGFELGWTNTRGESTRRFFRYLWAIWALLALLLMVPFATGKGHPPGFVFIPLVAVGWLVGHLVIWLFAVLTRRLSERYGELVPGAAASQPSVWIAKGLLGLTFLSGTGFVLFLTLGTIFWGAHSPTSFWVGVLAAWSVHGVALVGLIAGFGWSRLFTAAVFSCWTISLVVVGVILMKSSWWLSALCLLGAGLAALLVKELWELWWNRPLPVETQGR